MQQGHPGCIRNGVHGNPMNRKSERGPSSFRPYGRGIWTGAPSRGCASLHPGLLSAGPSGSNCSGSPIQSAKETKFDGKKYSCDFTSTTVVFAFGLSEPGLKAVLFWIVFRRLKPSAPSADALYNWSTRPESLCFWRFDEGRETAWM